jgi:hypothetical protein
LRCSDLMHFSDSIRCKHSDIESVAISIGGRNLRQERIFNDSRRS